MRLWLIGLNFLLGAGNESIMRNHSVLEGVGWKHRILALVEWFGKESRDVCFTVEWILSEREAILKLGIITNLS